jgi:hypothetical protein
MVGVWSSAILAVVSAKPTKPTFEYYYQVPFAKGKWIPSSDCGDCGGYPCCIDPSLPNATGSCNVASPDCADIDHGYGSWYYTTHFADVLFADGLQSAIDFSFHPIVRNRVTVLDTYQVCALNRSRTLTQSSKFVECLLMKQPIARHCEFLAESECESVVRADVWSCSQVADLDMWWSDIDSCFHGSLGQQLSSEAFARSTDLLQQVSDSSTESFWILNGQPPTCSMYTHDHGFDVSLGDLQYNRRQSKGMPWKRKTGFGLLL